MVARLTLDQLVEVRILVPQWCTKIVQEEFALGAAKHPEQVTNGERNAPRDKNVACIYFGMLK